MEHLTVSSTPVLSRMKAAGEHIRSLSEKGRMVTPEKKEKKKKKKKLEPETTPMPRKLFSNCVGS